MLDLFALLMATKLLARAERESNKQRQRDMPRLARASVTLAKAARVLLAAGDQPVSATELWEEIERVASREKVTAAVAAVEEFAPFGATDAGAPILAAARSLPDLAGRKRVWPEEVDGSLVTGSWRRLVFSGPDLPAGTVDHHAYALCVCCPARSGRPLSRRR